MNDKGQIIGNAFNATSAGGAAVWQADQIAYLNTMIPSGSGWVLGGASGINNRGQIIGSGTQNEHDSSFLLTPLYRQSSSSLRISNLSWYLGAYPVGQTSDAGTIYIYADGPDPLDFAGTTIERMDNSDFFVTSNTCGAVLAPYHTCAVSFAYKPSATGWRNASLALQDNSSGGPYTIPLSGLGY